MIRKSPPKRAPGLAGRLLAAQLLVVLAGAVTAWLVTAVVGPPLFRDHIRQSGGGDAGQQRLHAEEAFRSATAIAFSVALLSALAMAFAVSVFATRRIGRSVAAVADAATDVAGGRYDARLPSPSLGPEFDALAGAFNQMADRLGSVETTRRRLLADLAHEMRTPVATLDAYLEGLEDGVTHFDTGTATLLRGQTQRLARLAADISAVSRAEERQLPLSRRRLEPDTLIRDVEAAAREGYAAKGVLLGTEVPAGLSDLHADADRLGQVFGNLLDNALRHTPPGGSVTIAARPTENGVEIAVIDTGDGIAAEHLPHVFERFYRVDAARDREHGGSGIGLAISKALVEAHGGRIGVSSTGPGMGSTFTVWLPAR